MGWERGALALYLVTDRGLVGEKGMALTIGRAIKGGVTAVQLREKRATTEEFIGLAKEVKNALRGTGVPLIINDRVDVAKVVAPHGIHLGQTDAPPKEARSVLGPSCIIGLSVSGLEDVERAQEEEVDYLGVGPLFPTTTKEVGPCWSREELRKIKNMTSLPLVGIGGIREENAGHILNFGFSGVAVCRAICGASSLDEVEDRSRALRKVVGKKICADR